MGWSLDGLQYEINRVSAFNFRQTIEFIHVIGRAFYAFWLVVSVAMHWTVFFFFGLFEEGREGTKENLF